MSNVLSEAKAKIWSRNVQRTAKMNLVARLICSFREQSNLRDGQSVYRPALNRPTEGAVSADGTYTPSDITATKQELIVDQWRHASVYINEKDAAQVSVSYVALQSGYAGEVLGERLDRVILAEYVNADYFVAAAAMDKTNVASQALAGINKLRNAKCERGMGWAWVVDPEIDGYITEKYMDSGFNQADAKLVQGSLVYARPFLGLTVLISNGGLSWTGEVALAVHPGNAETVTVNGVVLTILTTLGATAGNVLRGANVAATGANLAAIINDPATTTAQGVALTAANQLALSEISASYDSNVLSLTSKTGRITLTTTLAGTGNGTQNAVLHTILLKRGAIDLVFQKQFKVQEKDVNRKLGKDIVSSGLYGYKTFDDGARCMCDIRVLTAADVIA